MCAIAGILDLAFDQQTVDSMLKTMNRRGPDASAYFSDRSCALLHTRLAVIDPEGGSQPMTWDRGDESFTIVYNGELYNTIELKAQLSSLGHVFRTHSDTEVLLHAYAQWKDECPEKCNGIFSFAVWEHRSGCLFMARDRMGVKPLFYKRHEGGLLFASELKTILRYPTVRAQLDAQGASEILLLGPGRTPGNGVFHGIEELEPGCCAYYRYGNLQCKRYWRLLDREHTQSLEETAQFIGWLVQDAIRRQTVSDVPIGMFLSGGLDSSIITAVCARDSEKTGGRVQTFSVDYENNERYFVPNKFQPDTDNYYIDLMQRQFNTDHSTCLLSAQELVDGLEAAVEARDLPGMADVDISLLAFCRAVRGKVTVVLSGECADEIFGGYPWFRDPQIRDQDGFPWAQNTQYRCSLLSDSLKDEIDPQEYIHQRYEKTCKESDILPGVSALERRMKEMENLNLQWFMQTLLDRKDRMSMYSGLEVRVPFCDHRIAEYMYGVPWEMKNYLGREKGLLRLAMEGILPKEILWRKKSPYPKTWDPMYLQLVTRRLRKVLQERDAPLFSLVSRSAVEQMLDTESVWPWYGQLMRRPQTICYLLQINEWLKRYKVEIIF